MDPPLQPTRRAPAPSDGVQLVTVELAELGVRVVKEVREVREETVERTVRPVGTVSLVTTAETAEAVVRGPVGEGGPTRVRVRGRGIRGTSPPPPETAARAVAPGEEELSLIHI